MDQFDEYHKANYDPEFARHTQRLYNALQVGRPARSAPVGYIETRAAIIADPAATYWLRDAMAALEKRDPVDALKDAETLLRLAQLRVTEILGTDVAAHGETDRHEP